MGYQTYQAKAYAARPPVTRPPFDSADANQDGVIIREEFMNLHGSVSAAGSSRAGTSVTIGQHGVSQPTPPAAAHGVPQPTISTPAPMYNVAANTQTQGTQLVTYSAPPQFPAPPLRPPPPYVQPGQGSMQQPPPVGTQEGQVSTLQQPPHIVTQLQGQVNIGQQSRGLQPQGQMPSAQPPPGPTPVNQQSWTDASSSAVVRPGVRPTVPNTFSSLTGLTSQPYNVQQGTMTAGGAVVTGSYSGSQNLFDALDTNGDGVISREEFNRAVLGAVPRTQ